MVMAKILGDDERWFTIIELDSFENMIPLHQKKNRKRKSTKNHIK